MTLLANTVTLTFVTGMFFLSDAVSQVTKEPIAVKTLHADLNGDGVGDGILFICYDPERLLDSEGFGFDRFVLDIESRFTIFSGVNLDATCFIVDIDTTDSYKEIAVPESGPSGDYATHFFYFTGDSIIFMGTLPGTYDLKVDGSGEVRTKQRGRILHTWFYPACYRLTKKHQFRFMKQELYIMNQSVTLRSNLALQTSPTDTTLAILLHPGDKGTIVGSDDQRWCLFQTESGIKGWFAVERFSNIVGTHRRATDVFDGLDYAD
jgi:hypothetical protein